MGDVGSGSLGLLIFALSAMLWRVQTPLLWPCLILSSAFVTDASLTLLNRMVRGRRWYTAHREHLYQWIVRRGCTHAVGAAWYVGWNLLVAAPLAALAFKRPGMGLLACIVTYAVAAVVWLAAKRRLIRRDRYKVRYVHT
jgi:UDP-N-acetylmuramyl pentapeptide phosphotransferase/UDP-N-acetylglucosamine-1-phosphate transferase